LPAAGSRDGHRDDKLYLLRHLRRQLHGGEPRTHGFRYRVPAAVLERVDDGANRPLVHITRTNAAHRGAQVRTEAAGRTLTRPEVAERGPAATAAGERQGACPRPTGRADPSLV